MRLIDADALRGPLMAFDSKVLDVVDNAPTINAMQVVRCKDCRWGREACGNIECFVDSNIPTEYHGYEWFCPNGERKDNEIY